MFYKVGAKLFLTGRSTIGNKEKFCMHLLQFYIPGIAKITFNRHGLGIGILKMQGFERQNKESKNILRRLSNNRRSVVLPNLRRLCDVFYNEKNAC